MAFTQSNQDIARNQATRDRVRREFEEAKQKQCAEEGAEYAPKFRLCDDGHWHTDSEITASGFNPVQDGEKLVEEEIFESVVQPTDAPEVPAGEQRPAKGEQRPAKGEQRPAKGEQRPTSGEQRLPEPQPQLIAGEQRLPEPQPQLIAGEQRLLEPQLQPITGEQRPTSGEQRLPEPQPQPGEVIFNSEAAKPRLEDGPAYFPVMTLRTKEEVDAEALAKLLEPENLMKLQREAEAGGFGCPECYHTGWVVEFGQRSKCKCQNLADQRKRDQAEVKARKARLDVDAALAGGEKAVRLGIVPKARANDDFDADIAKGRIMQLTEVTHAIQPRGVEEYLTCLQTILAAITANTLNCSYVIGAPKCCGKTTFVMTALKRLVNADKKVVPYLSLSKLAEIQKGYVEHVKTSNWAKLDGIKQGEGQAELGDDVPRCTWAEVLRADVLFAYLTSFEAATVELPVLQGLLQERGMKGRPTIIMTENPVAVYDRNQSLKRLFWNDIQNYTDEPMVKKLTHVSTWRVYPGGVPKEAIRAERGKEY